jgi:hypothetical protein
MISFASQKVISLPLAEVNDGFAKLMLKLLWSFFLNFTAGDLSLNL